MMATLYKVRAILGSTHPDVEGFFTFDTLLGPRQKAVFSIFVKDGMVTFTRKQDSSKLTLKVSESCPRVSTNRRYVLLDDKTLILLEKEKNS